MFVEQTARSKPFLRFILAGLFYQPAFLLRVEGEGDSKCKVVRQKGYLSMFYSRASLPINLKTFSSFLLIS